MKYADDLTHMFSFAGTFILLDVNSGAVHQLSAAAYELACLWRDTGCDLRDLPAAAERARERHSQPAEAAAAAPAAVAPAAPALAVPAAAATSAEAAAAAPEASSALSAAAPPQIPVVCGGGGGAAGGGVPAL
ncbi:MAG: hypothetical protein FWG28_08275, partial [Clostridiales bacterium]|nr:hypothetical protein [Clostridiales bacterium]